MVRISNGLVFSKLGEIHGQHVFKINETLSGSKPLQPSRFLQAISLPTEADDACFRHFTVLGSIWY